MEAVDQEIRWHTKKLGKVEKGSEVVKYVRECMDTWLEGLVEGQQKYEVLRWGLEVMHLAMGDSSVLSLPWAEMDHTVKLSKMPTCLLQVQEENVKRKVKQGEATGGEVKEEKEVKEDDAKDTKSEEVKEQEMKEEEVMKKEVKEQEEKKIVMPQTKKDNAELLRAVEDESAKPLRMGEELVTPLPRTEQEEFATPRRTGEGDRFGDSSWSPRRKVRSPGAEARSRRRLLQFHAKMESKLGPSRLHLLSRDPITPTTTRAREHHLQGTNLLGEFERMGEEQERWETGAAGHQEEQRGGEEMEQGGRDDQEQGRRLEIGQPLRHLPPPPAETGGGDNPVPRAPLKAAMCGSSLKSSSTTTYTLLEGGKEVQGGTPLPVSLWGSAAVTWGWVPRWSVVAWVWGPLAST